MMSTKRFLGIAVLAALIAACGEGVGDTTLGVAWSFAAGDCASHGVESVRVSWGPQGGPTEQVEFACSDGDGTLGEVDADRGSYSIVAEGLDAQGLGVAESYGTTTTFSGAPGGHVVPVTLHPKRADVTVTWTLSSGGTCPPNVVLPFYITLYEAPATAGGSLTDVVTETQVSCSAGQATLSGVAPGSYVVELDSRAVTPLVRGTAPVRVEPGQDVEVSIEF